MADLGGKTADSGWDRRESRPAGGGALPCPPASRLTAPHPHPGVRDEGGGGEEGIPPRYGALKMGINKKALQSIYKIKHF